MDRLGDLELRRINQFEVNWNISGNPNCTRCELLPQWPPTAGSYAATLRDFETSLHGTLEYPRSKVRLLVLFLEPRPSEKNFVAVPPDSDPSKLNPPEHKYFCLTRTAWHSLGLHLGVGGSSPRWPDEVSAPEYIRRYICGGSGWSYDAFIAYLLYRIRPEDAYITNLAKCYLEKSKDSYSICAKEHLSREIQHFQPNLVISFTSRVKSASVLQKLCQLQSPAPTVLYLYHFAAYAHHDKAKGFRTSFKKAAGALQKLSLDVQPLLDAWEHDCRALGRETA